MSAKRWPILVGIVMFAACGQKSSEPTPTSGTAAPAPTAPKAAISGREGPSLAAPVEDPPVAEEPSVPPTPAPPSTPPANLPTPTAEFERQTRDPSWAGPTEQKIKRRVGDTVSVETECRHDRCMIALRGGEDDMADAIAKIESPSGLQGFATSIYLTKPVEQNGKLVVKAYATFDR